MSGNNPEIENIKFASCDNLQLFIFSINISEFDVIGIDEFSLFNKGDEVECVVNIVEKDNKHVIVSVLDGTSERKKFNYYLDLIPFADSYVKLKGYCKICALQKRRKKALFTHRLDKEIKEETFIGGKGEYIPVCRECYLKLNE